MLQKNFFWISAFFGRFLTKKPAKKNNWQNPDRLMKFSEIWYVVASQQKNATKKLFWILAFFSPFLNQKTAKIDQK